MTELALTRIFSVTMYYHFAFLAISIALFGLSASGVYVYLARGPLGRDRASPPAGLARAGVRPRDHRSRSRSSCGSASGLNYSLENLLLMLAIYALAALPFFAGGAVVSLAISRLAGRINLGLRRRPARRVGGLPAAAAAARPGRRARRRAGHRRARRHRGRAASPRPPRARRVLPLAVAAGCSRRGPRTRRASCPSTSRHTKGHAGDTVLFSKWNSFSRVAVYDRRHGDWSLSADVRRPDARFALHGHRLGRIDAHPPLLRRPRRASRTSRSELTALGYHLRAARLHGARHRTRRRPRPAVRAGVRRARAWTAWRSTRSSRTT